MESEMLIETARFWVSRVVLSENHYHLKEVVGPDEYHHGVTDNAFTNWMVRLQSRSRDSDGYMAFKGTLIRFAELSSKLNLAPDEISEWQDIFNRLYIPQPGENGVIEQFEGFFAP